MLLQELKSPKTYFIVTGPLAAGKSTKAKELAKSTGLKAVGEFQSGVDIAEPKWWQELIADGDANGGSILETHFWFNGYEALDTKASLGKVIVPPKNIKVVFVIPNESDLLRQQKRRDKFSNIEDVRTEIKWYKDIKAKMGM